MCEEGLYCPICKCHGFTGEFSLLTPTNAVTKILYLPGTSPSLYCSDLAHVSLLPKQEALTLEEVVGSSVSHDQLAPDRVTYNSERTMDD